jgi:hypothetical protein
MHFQLLSFDEPNELHSASRVELSREMDGSQISMLTRTQSDHNISCDHQKFHRERTKEQICFLRNKKVTMTMRAKMSYKRLLQLTFLFTVMPDGTAFPLSQPGLSLWSFSEKTCFRSTISFSRLGQIFDEKDSESKVDKKLQKDDSGQGRLMKIWYSESFSNFRAGALHVHENFLELLWRETRLLWLMALPLLLVVDGRLLVSREEGVCIMTAISEKFYTFYTFLFWIEESTTIAFLVSLLASLWLILWPFGVLWSDPIQALMKIVIIRKAELLNVPVTNTIPPRLSSPSLFLSVIDHVVVAPILEEVIYRLFLPALLKRLCTIGKGGNSNKEQKGPTSGPLIFGYTPYVLLSSIWFGLRHIGNHVKAVEGITPHQPTIVLSAFGAFYQSFGAIWIALVVLSPLFETKGLAASIGAHAMWNLSVFKLPMVLRLGWFLLTF